MLKRTLTDLSLILDCDIQDDRIIEGYTVDSREVKTGFVFFALRGSKVDGHDFLIDSFHRGAIAAVVDSSFKENFPGHVLLRVNNPLEALQGLAKRELKRQSKRIVGITGSVGKTTTKEFCYQLLSSKFKVFRTPGNANSQIGLPLSVLNRGEFDEDILVLEMGMSSNGHISKLVSIAPPELAVITKIAPAHIEFFSDGLEGIAAAKSEILTSSKTSKAIINWQARSFLAVSKTGNMEKRYFFLRNTLLNHNIHSWLEEENGDQRYVNQEEKSPLFSMPFEAKHLQENLLAAIEVARYFGCSWEEILSKVRTLSLPENRFERIEKNGIIYIKDCYNANPESMMAALQSLPKPKPGGKVYAALGWMAELGIFSELYHEKVGDFAASYVDVLYCLGKECENTKIAFEKKGGVAKHFFDLELMKKELRESLKEGDVVLIKASNIVQLSKILDDE
ncbi:MAG: UDP-N-acetylmuramoyl-tripeptide--D-alanyl-D-alanine ligase [Chlamydiae bacterium]|nr:UDP-N-acetylmuramoyl-tripeptide--D-alanyl-D-alanine ligase [Chlamydiota bacterium]